MKSVTAIMPTRGRRELAAKALACFLAQTYERRRLLILDDADDPSFQEPPQVDGVDYVRLDTRLDVAAKRNEACRLADADVICHWDSDDWSAPERIAQQVQLLMESDKAVTGYRQMYFYRPLDNRAARYDGAQHFALGTSLVYRRDWWAEHPFTLPPATSRRVGQKPYGEDGRFVKQASAEGQIHSVSGLGMMVALAHADNTCRKNLKSYKTVHVSELPRGFFD